MCAIPAHPTLARLSPTGPIDLWLSPWQPGEASEGLLRRALGARLGAPPTELDLRRGARGKPELAAGELAFNLSHADDLALIGIAEEGAIGVDLERLRPRRRLDLLTEQVLTDAERDLLPSGGERARTEWFLRCWTAKEAVAKAFGAGLALAPQRLEVERIDRDRALVGAAGSAETRLPAGESVEVRWIRPAEGFVAAVAARDAWRECRPPRWFPA